VRTVEWIVLDDIKLNLIGALIVLILAASFTNAIDLPFRLTKIPDQVDSGASKVRSTKILIFRRGDTLAVGIGEQIVPLEESEALLKKINPSLPVKLAVQDNSGFSYDQLVGILASLKRIGIRNVSIMAKK
jgi:biopolymer transport protein ExbD